MRPSHNWRNYIKEDGRPTFELGYAGGGWPTFGPLTLRVPRPRYEAVKKLVVFSLRESEGEFLWIRSGGSLRICLSAFSFLACGGGV
jgi:hypothetical protein